VVEKTADGDGLLFSFGEREEGLEETKAEKLG